EETPGAHDTPTPMGGMYKDLRQAIDQARQSIADARQTASWSSILDEVKHEARALGTTSAGLAEKLDTKRAALHRAAQCADAMANAPQQMAGQSEAAAKGEAVVARAVAGTQTVRSAVEAMKRMESYAGKINEVTTVIDGIAFQTNLLALNASVEAARAGEAGKGFAVVATEVRNLAQRSADAAKDIAALIAESTAGVGEGSKCVRETGETLEDIRQAAQSLADEISAWTTNPGPEQQTMSDLRSAIAEATDATGASTETADALTRRVGSFVERVEAVARPNENPGGGSLRGHR
ncbi:MAG: methyl-accepting chemotaxis protein, partial [Pseudomonadota bacterium]